MNDLLGWDECPERINDPSGDTRHDLYQCVCQYCAEVIHKWNGCVCSSCGETRHEFPQYSICPTCGKKIVGYHYDCHVLQSEGIRKYDCKCIRCYTVIHDFKNQRCTRCFAWEEHDHISDGWYKLRLTEGQLYYRFTCTICKEEIVQKQKPAQEKSREWNHQPFVFRNAMKAFIARELIELCYQFPQDGSYHLMEGHFEPWLDDIGERNLSAICRKLRTQNSEFGPRQKLDALIAEFCYSDNMEFQHDGQNWVAGWD